MVGNRWAAMALFCAVGCGRASSSSASPTLAGVASEEEQDAGIAPMDTREAAQWAAAAGGDPEELMRAQDLVGCAGLRDRASQPDLRALAIRAMRYCDDYSELPWLVEVAAGKNDAEARAALEVVDDLAARPRRATDPEDAAELHAGCAALLALAQSTSRPRERRVLAIRALRMLTDRGCVVRADIPTDVDAK